MAKQLFDEMLYVPLPMPGGDNPQLRLYIERELTRLSNALSAAVDGDIQGVSGTFTTVDSKTVTVTNGIITDIT
jgi:hypothetical protein